MPGLPTPFPFPPPVAPAPFPIDFGHPFGGTLPEATTPESPQSDIDALYADQPYKVADAAERLANTKSLYQKDWIVTVYDKMWRPVGELGDDMLELDGSDPRNALPTAVLKIKGDSDLTEAFSSCTNSMVGVTVETGGIRYAYYVDEFDREYRNGEWTGTANLLGIWDVLNYLIIWPDFFFPIQAQPISHAVFIWALVSVIETMIAEQAARMRSGLLEFFNNALSLNPDIRAWFGNELQSSGGKLERISHPVYVVRTNPFGDTSPPVAKTVRMESCGTVITDMTKAYGVDVRVDLWLPGDAQPDRWKRLIVPTYVVTVKDRSQIEGPTKTILDSAIRGGVDLLGSFFGEIGPLVKQVPSMQGVYTSPVLGIDFTLPWVVLVAPDQGEKGSVLTCKISHHTPKGWQHIIGGRSPKWLNDLMNATYAWIIDSISILIGFSGIPSNLLEGFMNNAFLAFQLVEVYERRNKVGPYHPAMETFTATASSPYNIETVFGFINKIWDTRGYIAAQATFEDGQVYKLGKDLFRGGLASVVYDQRTKMFTDYVQDTRYHITTTERHVQVQIGDGKAQEAPLAKHQRFITGTIEAINVLTLAPQS